MVRKRSLQPFEFVQRVPDAGFEWVRGKAAQVNMAAAEIETAKSEWFLREKLLPPYRGRTYKPLIAHTGLFRDFSETDPTRTGIQAFANNFGSLGSSLGEEITLVITRQSSVSSLQDVSFRTWTSEILLMRALVQLWDATRAGDVMTLSKFIEWKNGTVVYHGPTELGDKRRLLIASPALNLETLQRFLPGDVIQPARVALRRITNELLTQHRTTPRLVPDQDNGSQLCHVPESMNAVLWLQFALAQASEYEFKRCMVCGLWFQVGRAPDARRGDAAYCSNRCRQKNYRDNKGVAK